MDTSYEALKADYAKTLSELKLVRERDLVVQARTILGEMQRYNMVAHQTSIPASWIAAIDFRESSNDPHTYLGNGDSLYKVTTDVPVGRGPFQTWEQGALDALRFVLPFPSPSTLTYAAWQAERWNGFGYRRRGVTNPYLWSGSTGYTGGMFVRDHVYDHDAVDPRVGVIPLMIVIGELASAYALEFFDSSEPTV
jgi:lysozyme family protein